MGRRQLHVDGLWRAELLTFPTSCWPGVGGTSLGQDLPGPKVSFASRLRWGTEPEGWCVDLPDAVLVVGVNYSPLECRRSNRGAGLVSIEIAGHERKAMATAPGICPLASTANPLFLLVCRRTRPLDL